MDKILGLGDVFGLGGSNFNSLLLIPVLFVVVSAAAVFVFGFKKAENPKFRKIVSSSSSAVSGADAGSKRKKRANANTATAAATGAAIISASVQASTNANKSQQQQQPLATHVSKTVRKEPAAAKKPPTTAAAINKPTKKTNAKSVSSNNNNNKAANATTVDAEAVGGEWQTVLTKKQKQQKQSDPQLAAEGDVAELIAVAFDKQAIAAAKKKIAASNNKKAVAKKQQSQQQQPELELAAQSVAVAEALLMQLMESKEIPLAEPSANIAVNESAHNNLVFDELGDAEWMQTKPQKKNKKRALRE